jgi:hypothetical protein
MRLLTHNQLVCVRKGCAAHYPLALAATKVEQSADGRDEEEEEVDEEEEAAAQLDFVLHLLPNVDYAVLRAAATTVSDSDSNSHHSRSTRCGHERSCALCAHPCIALGCYAHTADAPCLLLACCLAGRGCGSAGVAAGGGDAEEGHACRLVEEAARSAG